MDDSESLTDEDFARIDRARDRALEVLFQDELISGVQERISPMTQGRVLQAAVGPSGVSVCGSAPSVCLAEVP